ncbi:sulfurtransferase [Adhaeribacter arboris]|uniref:Sulfurtransferase n=1 Tax=Adhaeribacter arboris TaxID=2072846 RepID=A0A2T2YMY5_9BACT|nr:sulfurtransferase [Adhaeribacter arboris]PSR56867.1 sulfurtransferase [Adhaeribacter arboris]
MTPVIHPSELILLQQNPELVLIDARTGPEVKAKYQARHLQGARLVDLEQELSQKKAVAAEGGRHPLPDVSFFAEVLGRLGIGPESYVVVYDDKNGANAAARFWWMLKAAGHEKVQVLNGGFEAAIAAGYPTSSAPEDTAFAREAYPVKTWQLPTATLSDVEKATQSSDYLVIDVRESERYRGEREPIDLVAGHIPGAVNIPFSTNLDQNGFYLPAEELKAKYSEALAHKNANQVIVHCGSGVTACHTLVAMAQAGLEIPQLYVGSWSEWSRNDKPIATEV